jgi:hypothetical protein
MVDLPAGTPTTEMDVGFERRRKLAGRALFASLALGGAVMVAVFVASLRQTPGLEGVFTGLFAGVFAGLLIAAGGAWLALQLVRRPTVPGVEDLSVGDALRDQLAGALAELEQVRLETHRQIQERASIGVPVGVAGGLALWVLGLLGEDPPDYEALVAILAMGGLAGYAWAATRLSNRYDGLYKKRVLPALARSLGGLDYSPHPVADTAALQEHLLFRRFDRAVASDGFSGLHRGLPISVMQLKLTTTSGNDETAVFDGLLLQVDLPRRLSGTTAVIHDAGGMGNLRDRIADRDRQRVRLEDPLFESRYEVYGTDQVEARALLNPAFMERFLRLGDSVVYGAPQALAVDSRLHLALPKRSPRDLFQPPGFRKPADCRATLQRLHGDLSALLAAADAAIGLDSPGRLRS